MNIIKTGIEGLVVIEPKIFGDERGYFFESYSKKKLEEAGIFMDFVQDNQSRSSFGILRGLHYQTGEFAQSKLVRVVEGEVLDVAVDIREGSPTYGQHFSIILSADNKKQLLIPRGFAHGFIVLSPTVEFTYKCDNFYNKASEGGLLWNDKQLNIDWKIDERKVKLSEKDVVQPTLGNHKKFFV